MVLLKLYLTVAKLYNKVNHIHSVRIKMEAYIKLRNSSQKIKLLFNEKKQNIILIANQTFQVKISNSPSLIERKFPERYQQKLNQFRNEGLINFDKLNDLIF